MKKLNLLLLILVSILLVKMVLAVCTVTLDKDSYFVEETITADMVCTEATEKSDPYTLNWTYQNGTQVEEDSGTTPSTISEHFYQTFIIPSSWESGVWINATLVGGDLDAATTSANISSVASANSLLITNVSTGDGWVGMKTSIKARVTDENGKKISGGVCRLGLLSNDETNVREGQITTITDGGVKGVFDLTTDNFAENTDYTYHVHCFCGSDGSSQECINEDGSTVEDSIGTTTYPFTTNTWLTVNTVTDESLYSLKDEIFVCANVTNVAYSLRIPLKIYYQVRCSAGSDNNFDTDRILIAYNSPDDPDMRGISTNTTQMQCKKFKIPEEYYLMGHDSECYSSSEVWVLDKEDEELIGYATTSPVFNISSDELNLEGDWAWVSDNTINTVINLSNFADITGEGTGEVDVRIDFPNSEMVELHHSIESLNLFENITIWNLTGLLTEHIDYELEILEDGYLEIELRNVNLDKTNGESWWNLTLEFYDNVLNLTEQLAKGAVALEGIESKTGTFHLEVDCPSENNIGENMNCTLSAQIEDPQTVQKEVDFTCYILDGNDMYSSTNFNRMITQTPITLYQQFLIPDSFRDNLQYILQCHADYYNLGSRRDSFYDTFTARASVISPGGGGGDGSTGTAPEEEKESDEEDEDAILGITGEVTKDKENKTEKPTLTSTQLGKKTGYTLGFLFILLILIILGKGTYDYLRRKNIHRRHKPKNKNLTNLFRIIFALVVVILIILVVFSCGKLFVSYLKESNYVEKGPTEPEYVVVHPLLQDSLFRGTILTFAIVLAIILLAKALHIRGEIRFGNDPDRYYQEDKKNAKLQNKLNRMILRNEIESEKHKIKDKHKTKKISIQEFNSMMNKFEDKIEKTKN